MLEDEIKVNPLLSDRVNAGSKAYITILREGVASCGMTPFSAKELTRFRGGLLLSSRVEAEMIATLGNHYGLPLSTKNGYEKYLSFRDVEAAIFLERSNIEPGLAVVEHGINNWPDFFGPFYDSNFPIQYRPGVADSFRFASFVDTLQTAVITTKIDEQIAGFDLTDDLAQMRKTLLGEIKPKVDYIEGLPPINPQTYSFMLQEFMKTHTGNAIYSHTDLVLPEYSEIKPQIEEIGPAVFLIPWYLERQNLLTVKHPNPDNYGVTS